MRPKVIELIKIYKKGNLQKVNEYLSHPEMVIDSSSWEGHIKKLIDDKLFVTAKNEIELVGYKFLKL